jgi:soluble lytic murein transglycosylase-like protein
MKVNPRNMVIPIVFVISICLIFLSLKVNTGFAQPSSRLNPGLTTKQQNASNQLNRLFPESIRRWKSIIETTGSASGMDPNLIASIILQESGGNYLALSNSGAVGLMQVMPKDGIASQFLCGTQPCFIDRPSIKELENPEFNIEFGSNYLAELIDQKGSLREALKVYGPMDVGYDYADIVLSIYEKYH